MKWLRDLWVVASFDLAESLRSRKIAVFIVLYVVGAIAATLIFTELLQTIEEELAEQLLVARTSMPGSMTDAVMERPELRRVLSKLVGDRELALTLLSIPPVALLFGWVTITFAPIFVVFTSSDSMSTELASGSVRFSLVRTERSAWAFGKLLSHTLLLLLSVALAGVATWITAYFRLSVFDGSQTARWIVRYMLTASCFAFAHLGMVLGASQLTRSVPWSRALGLAAVIASFGVERFLRSDFMQRWPVVADSLRQVFPPAHRLDLWRPSALDVGATMVLLSVLGLTFFILGYIRFARRDT